MSGNENPWLSFRRTGPVVGSTGRDWQCRSDYPFRRYLPYAIIFGSPSAEPRSITRVTPIFTPAGPSWSREPLPFWRQ